MNEIELIKKAQKGNTEAFQSLVHEYDRKVLDIAYHFRNNREDANDIYQEVFLRVFKGLKNFKFKSEFSTWLFRITTNVCISHKSRISKHKIESIDKNINSDEESISFAETIISESKTDSLTNSNEISFHVNKQLEQLPPRQKMAFTLKYYDGYKIREIAEIMNCSDGAVKRYIFLSVKKLKKNLKFLQHGN